MKFVWTEDLSVGIGEIDAQHREFIRLMSDLPDELSESYDAKKAIERIISLEEYAGRHFGTEEMFMSVYGYPPAGAHKVLHDKFRSEIKLMRERAEHEEKPAKILELNHTIYNWFVEHIKVTDMKLGAFLKSKLKQ
jgi:hemerythrin